MRLVPRSRAWALAAALIVAAGLTVSTPTAAVAQGLAELGGTGSSPATQAAPGIGSEHRNAPAPRTGPARTDADPTIPRPTVPAGSHSEGGLHGVTALPRTDRQYAATPMVSALSTSVLSTSVLPERIGGADRFATAAKIAHQFGHADAVIVANGTNAKGGFDALSANYLAGQLGAPILLTAGETLEPVTATAVREVLTGSADPAIYVMGGEGVVSRGVADALNALASDIAGHDGDFVQRIGGASRYATSAHAATALADATVGVADLGESPTAPLPTAILASGAVNADALAAGPLSNAWHLPVLLTPASHLPADIAQAITDLGIKQLVVLGGTTRVSQTVIDEAAAAGVEKTTRIAGANRFVTAIEFYRDARSVWRGSSAVSAADAGHYAGGNVVFIANGVTGFPDALAAGPLAARHRAPLITVNSNDMVPETLDLLSRNTGVLDAVTVLGGTGTVSQAVLIASKAALGLNILQRPDGTLASDVNQQYLAAATGLSDFEQQLALAETYLPHGGKEISELYPYMLQKPACAGAAGCTFMGTCEIWMDDTLAPDMILDILRHEYIHALQCRSVQTGDATISDDSSGIDVERMADAGAYLLGSNYMYYVNYAPGGSPLTVAEVSAAQWLLNLFGITYPVG